MASAALLSREYDVVATWSEGGLLLYVLRRMYILYEGQYSMSAVTKRLSNSKAASSFLQ